MKSAAFLLFFMSVSAATVWRLASVSAADCHNLLLLPVAAEEQRLLEPKFKVEDDQQSYTNTSSSTYVHMNEMVANQSPRKRLGWRPAVKLVNVSQQTQQFEPLDILSGTRPILFFWGGGIPAIWAII